MHSSCENELSDDEPSGTILLQSSSTQIGHRYNSSAGPGTLGGASSVGSLEDADFVGALSQGGGIEQYSVCSSTGAPATPTSRSSTPAFPQDMEGSDNDEYHPPGFNDLFLFKNSLI